MSKELYTAVMGNPAIAEFLRAMGLDPAQCGDFEITAPLKGVITGYFHVFINTEQFAILKALAPEFRKEALLRVVDVDTLDEMEIR